jgi:hypothetical protein
LGGNLTRELPPKKQWCFDVAQAMKDTSEFEVRGGTPIYQLKITLKCFKPSVWRRVLVRADMPLNRLHAVIQLAMGWTDSHLHQFVIDGQSFGVPDPEVRSGTDSLNEKRYVLAQVAPDAKKKFLYEYDFGDGWEHEVLVEKILASDPAFKRPVCLAGAMACPPEDCGGVFGYYNLLQALADPKHPDHTELSEWIGGEWNPAEFDLEQTNSCLLKLKA